MSNESIYFKLVSEGIKPELNAYCEFRRVTRLIAGYQTESRRSSMGGMEGSRPGSASGLRPNNSGMDVLNAMKIAKALTETDDMQEEPKRTNLSIDSASASGQRISPSIGSIHGTAPLSDSNLHVDRRMPVHHRRSAEVRDWTINSFPGMHPPNADDISRQQQQLQQHGRPSSQHMSPSEGYPDSTSLQQHWMLNSVVGEGAQRQSGNIDCYKMTNRQSASLSPIYARAGGSRQVQNSRLEPCPSPAQYAMRPQAGNLYRSSPVDGGCSSTERTAASGDGTPGEFPSSGWNHGGSRGAVADSRQDLDVSLPYDDVRTDEKRIDERRVDEWRADDRRVDERRVVERGRVEERRVDERRVEERRADERRTDDRRTDERRVDDRRADERRIDDRRAEEWRVDDRRADERRVDERMVEEWRTDDRKTDERRVDEMKFDSATVNRKIDEHRRSGSDRSGSDNSGELLKRSQPSETAASTSVNASSDDDYKDAQREAKCTTEYNMLVTAESEKPPHHIGHHSSSSDHIQPPPELISSRSDSSDAPKSVNGRSNHGETSYHGGGGPGHSLSPHST